LNHKFKEHSTENCTALIVCGPHLSIFTICFEEKKEDILNIFKDELELLEALCMHVIDFGGWLRGVRAPEG
jgi:hypothetical protein